ncbi:TonB-dependent siderophore receptor [Nitrospirillum sp. BR 11752]|uniref:TonB-dependent siderophore receptor n=1 Tax=Nitrospirillum sp. BR 11752 TaxID=3104293 RepID=UPI002E9FBED2|nr:TonB-dependent siderophore receptor [Nitrospirillum sp. BR 11752]
MSGLCGSRFLGAAAAACLMLAPAAHAAGDEGGAGDGLDDITITAQKQPYRGDVPLQSMPQSLQVISSELLADIGATRLDTALDMAAGLARQNNFGGMWDSYAVRGFAGDENFPSGYLVNGFNASRGFGGPRDASNIDHIEILKGPNSALFGRGEPGGTVNILTKKPQFDPQGSVTLTAGNYADRRVEADVTGPVADTLALRLNGAYEDGHSFRDTVHTSKYTLTPSAFLRLNDQMTLSYEMEAVHQEVPFDRGVVAVNGQLGTIPASRFLGEPGDGAMDIDGLSHQLQFEDNFAGNWTLLVGLSYRETALKGYSSEAELTAARQKLYIDGQTLSRQRRYRDYETGDLVGRTELSGTFETGTLTHHLLVGADWDRFSYDQVQRRFRPTLANPNGINIFNPVYGAQPAVGNFMNALEIDNSGGVYFQDQIDLTRHWKLRVGARYDDYSQDILNRLTGGRTTLSDTAASPQAGLVYEVDDSLSFYASYGRGFRPNTGTDAHGNGFKPEETESREVGAKLSTPDGKLSGTVALYSMTKSNIMTADPVNAGFSLAIGEAESKGVEVDVSGTLPGDFKLWLSYAYTDAEVSKDFLDPNFGLAIHKGDRLINIPKHSGSVLLTRDFSVGGDGVVTLGGGVNYVGSRLGETGTGFTLPGYTLTRLIAAYAPTANWKISGEINNLFDETYYPSSYSRLWVTPGTPRTYRLHASYRF